MAAGWGRKIHECITDQLKTSLPRWHELLIQDNMASCSLKVQPEVKIQHHLQSWQQLSDCHQSPKSNSSSIKIPVIPQLGERRIIPSTTLHHTQPWYQAVVRWHSILSRATSEWMVGENDWVLRMRKPLHAVPPIKNRWKQAIFEKVIGSLVAALHGFEFHQKFNACRHYGCLVGHRKKKEEKSLFEAMTVAAAFLGFLAFHTFEQIFMSLSKISAIHQLESC